MPHLLDLILIAVPVILAVRGHRRGLVRSVSGIVRLTAAVLLTVALTAPVARFLDNTFLYSPVRGHIGERLETLAEKTDGEVSDLYKKLPAPMRAHLNGRWEADADIQETVSDWSDTISRAISGALSRMLATVLVFLLISFALKFGLRMLSGIIHATPLAGVDRLLGLLSGVIAGVAAVWLLSCILSPFLVTVGRPEWAAESWLLRMAV